MGNIKDCIKQNKCTGCTACSNCCPVSAITMQENEYGFIEPVIDLKKCINCGLCLKKCPQQNVINNDNKEYKIFALINKDKNTVLQSSSGGAFSLLAQYVIENNGAVFGAAWDENFDAAHICVKNIEDLSALRGAKYVQSDISYSFKSVKEFLEKGILVLFSGTPCQIAGLKSFLDKDYDNLLTADLICHGVPSRKVWREYLNQLLNKLNLSKKDISQISFRNKDKGWKNSQLVIYNKQNEKAFAESWRYNKFNAAFDLALNNPCLYCNYSKLPRIGDISIGDFWGIESINPKFFNKNGTSLIIVNNLKGEKFVKYIKNKAAVSKPISAEKAIKSNYNIVTNSKMHSNRTEFLECIKNNTFNIEEKISCYSKNNIVPKNSICILNYFYENTNYGALMVSFAMTRFLSKYGFNSVIADNSRRYFSLERLLSQSFIRFKQEYFKTTNVLNSNNDYIKLNNDFNVFIAGSDQIWNIEFASANLRHFLLDFVKTEKILISYAASFGKNEFSNDKKLINKTKKLLKRFDFISVREKSGIDVIKNTFGKDIQCVNVLDPTLLLNEDDYTEILKDEQLEQLPEQYIGHYLIHNTFNHCDLEQDKSFSDFIKRLNMPHINSRFKKISMDEQILLQYKPFHDWLNIIKNSTIFVTDSFHGVCFAIIFKKNFIYIDKSQKVNERLISLLSNLDIKNRIFKTFEEVNTDYIINNPIDYNNVYEKLNKLRDNSSEFFLNAVKKSNDKDYLIKKLEKSIKEKEEIIEELKKWNIKEIPNFIYKKLLALLGIILKKMGTSFGLKIFKILPKPLKELVKNLISRS